MDICQYCSGPIGYAEPRAEIKQGERILLFHQDHLKALLRTCQKELETFCQQTGLPVIKQVHFLKLETAQKAAQGLIDGLIAGSTDRQAIENLVQFVEIVRAKLLYDPTIPEPLKSEVERVIVKKFAPKLIAPAPQLAVKKSSSFLTVPAPAKFLRSPLPKTVLVKADHNEEFEENTELDRMKANLVQLRSDMLAIAERPFQLIWDISQLTGSTDCRGIIWLNPYFFEEGDDDIGRGIGYHEAGHIRSSGQVADAIRQAREQGGDLLAHLVNLIVDRHDDEKTAQEAPGFALTLRKRLASLFPGHRGLNPWLDFAYACKKRTKPRFPETAEALRIVKKLIRSGTWTTEAIIAAAKKVREALNQFLPEIEAREEEQSFLVLMIELEKLEKGPKLSASQKKELENAVTLVLSSERSQQMVKLERSLSSPLQSQMKQFAPPHKNSWEMETEILEMRNGSMAEYQRVVNQVSSHRQKLLNKLSLIDSPVEETLRYQEEGELDLGNLATLVVGLPYCFTQTYLVSDLDVEVHLALDLSGSMIGEKVEYARQLGALFNEAICAKRPHVEGYLWGYRSEKAWARIFNYGQAQVPSTVVLAEADGGNCDYEMLKVVAQKIVRSPRKKKLVIIVGDDGPSDADQVNLLGDQLLAAGIPVVHILVEVFAAPQIYPIQLLFRSFPDLIEEFGDILVKIFRWVKAG